MRSSSLSFPGIRSFTLRGLTLAIGLLALGACGGDDDPSGPSDQDIAEAWLESVDAGPGADVDIVSESAPDESNGPDVDAFLTGSFITGGTTQLVVSGESFDGLIVALDGVDGYVDISYNSERSEATVAVTLYGDLPDTEFSLLVAGTDGGDVGTYTEIPVQVVQVGSDGPIQVSVSWNTASDVDLHVVDPDGEEIYYGSSVSSTGGELDLDSNAACSIDGVNNENITWDDNDDPASGTYIVRVDYWDSCEQGPTDYIVTIRVEGEPTRTITGTLTGTGTHGGAGDGETVTTFTY